MFNDSAPKLDAFSLKEIGEATGCHSQLARGYGPERRYLIQGTRRPCTSSRTLKRSLRWDGAAAQRTYSAISPSRLQEAGNADFGFYPPRTKLRGRRIAGRLAGEALDRIGALYAIEKEIRGRSPDQRRAVRQERSRPLLEALHAWLTQTLATLSQKSATAKAIAYALTRWDALQRYCDDGRIEIDNNAAERALRCVALGRKNFLFAGSDSGGQSAAAFYSLLGSAKLNGHNLEAFLREVLARIGGHPINRIAELMPWNLKPTNDQALTPGSDAPRLPTTV